MNSITLAILAGGEGARMGRPKGELRLGGKAMLDYLLDGFAWPGPTLLVTAPGREHPPGYERFEREVVDAVAGEGPLRGIYTALEACRSEWIAITTVDMPGIERQHIAWLVNSLQAGGGMGPLGLMCSRDHHIEPFPCVLHRSAVVRVRAMLSAGERSVRSLAGVVCAVLPADWATEAWANLNRPGDLAKWLARR